MALFLFSAGMMGLFAQKAVSGVVTSEEDGKPMP